MRYPFDTPLANLYLSILQRAGVETQRFADLSNPFLKFTMSNQRFTEIIVGFGR